ncbi:unnamed protein product [Phaedon cochleariae]|uniref:Protein aurora borealis n=1 Tax=Phaedon cochleariae TaxID=80249 RepID=A0A9P0DSI4_PHACE|nr:unnamed protein product [Phaedon cochleariae]
MEFKYINDRNKTPKAKSSKVFSSTVNCDSPFMFLPNVSTPPSRFTRIINPFEHHLVDRLHLPMFSPSVFAKVSTPKSDEKTKFKWTIDDISSLKPADIDEGTISQHVIEEDPQVESLVQEKINRFFSEEVILPSPMTDIVRVPLVSTNVTAFNPQKLKEYSESSAQTILTLPPVLPKHIEDILKPYFIHTEDQQGTETNMKNTSLYRNLFEFESDLESDSRQSSPAVSTGLSPIQFSPFPHDGRESLPHERRESLPHESNPENQELRECSLSPIYRSPKESRSAVRLNFSNSMGMSIDASMAVPDIANQIPDQSVLLDCSEHALQTFEPLSDSTVNWEMEYRHVSLASPSSSPESVKMEVSNVNTPHSKIFTSQRKRLSDSFKEEQNLNEENMQSKEIMRQNRKLFKNDNTDAGYHTESTTFYDESMFGTHVFASTPTKIKLNN